MRMRVLLGSDAIARHDDVASAFERHQPRLRAWTGEPRERALEVFDLRPISVVSTTAPNLSRLLPLEGEPGCAGIVAGLRSLSREQGSSTNGWETYDRKLPGREPARSRNIASVMAGKPSRPPLLWRR